MTVTTGPSVDPQVADRIAATVLDYYEGWFGGDVERMRRALHPDLVKRGVKDSTRSLASHTAASMIDATERGLGTRHDPDQRSVDISINHVHAGIADVHATGHVYVDYLQLVEIDGRWQILNALWAPADASTLL